MFYYLFNIILKVLTKLGTFLFQCDFRNVYLKPKYFSNRSKFLSRIHHFLYA